MSITGRTRIKGKHVHFKTCRRCNKDFHAQSRSMKYCDSCRLIPKHMRTYQQGFGCSALISLKIRPELYQTIIAKKPVELTINQYLRELLDKHFRMVYVN